MIEILINTFLVVGVIVALILPFVQNPYLNWRYHEAIASHKRIEKAWRMVREDDREHISTLEKELRALRAELEEERNGKKDPTE